ncbi:MAG TPA: amine oxidase [Candidatus Latescibacteria bacterium]|jgi:phytoene dehydrogenase-like protein|nr:amine oxidase [Candidatus Latescibacterota bacterium]
MYDCIIIGAGHNGLVCSNYLAQKDWKVLVIEKRHVVGGACVTEEITPGYKASIASYVVSLLLPEIVEELELAKYGYKILPRNPSSFTPFEDGRYLFLGPDKESNHKEIRKFSEKDADAFVDYEAFLGRVAEHIEPALNMRSPDLLPLPSSWRKVSLSKRLSDLKIGRKLHKAVKSMGDDLPEAIELMTGNAKTILDRWFESDELKGTLATDAIIGTFQPYSAPGTSYVLLHHVMGAAGGARGVWAYVEGGMGALADSIAASAQAKGVEIRLQESIEEILVSDGQITGVRLEGGEVIDARRVASGVDPHLTFEKMMDPSHLPATFKRAVRNIDYSSASLKINLAVSELPDFTCLPGNGEVGPQHRGTIHIGAMPEYLERAYDDAKYGRPSQRPIVEMTIPTSIDKTLAPEGDHILSLFVQYAPYELAEGNWDDVKEEFADRCIAEIARYAPNVPASILHRQVLSPVDIERIFGLTGGNIFQGSMSLHQLGAMRPVPGWSDHRTPVDGLYICGSAAHPGGGVMGSCGRNAAQVMLEDGK